MVVGNKSYLCILCGILLNNYTCGGIVKLKVYPTNVSLQNFFLDSKFFITAILAAAVVVVVVLW